MTLATRIGSIRTLRMWRRILLLAGGALLWSTAVSGQNTQPWLIGPFTRPVEGNPVITARPESTFIDPITKKADHWEALNTFNPAAIVRGDKVYLFYRAEDDSGTMMIGGHTSRLGLAESTDGIHFTRRAEPVFFPEEDAQKSREWTGGVEDPRIVEADDGRYVMMYTQYNQHDVTLGVATSRDLLHWTKYGPVFQEALGDSYGVGKGDRAWPSYKSGAVVTELKGGRLIAARINGKYWMYWGERTGLASSPDLIHWTPVEDVQGPIRMLPARPGKFDSGFPEGGPPAVLTKNGIVVLYNGKNAASEAEGADPSVGLSAYAVGEALFDRNDPERLIDRTTVPVFRPEMPFEKSGQYTSGTTFAEGLVYFHKRWFLYYGCADSRVGVAMTAMQ
jgi:predicted GH43/DUF377 family glycosyl hydrolase